MHVHASAPSGGLGLLLWILVGTFYASRYYLCYSMGDGVVDSLIDCHYRIGLLCASKCGAGVAQCRCRTSKIASADFGNAGCSCHILSLYEISILPSCSFVSEGTSSCTGFLKINSKMVCLKIDKNEGFNRS